jgi:hypothetical protein
MGVAAALAWQTLRDRGQKRAFLFRVILPAAGAMCCGAALTAYYFRAVTGSPWLLPYRINQQLYGWPMTLAWFHPPSLDHANPQMHRYYLWELGLHTNLFHVPDLLYKAESLWRFFIGPVFTVALLFGCRAWRGCRIRPLLLIGGAVALAVMTEQSGYPHYLSPATVILVAVVVQSMRHLRAGGPKGVALVRGLLVVLLAAAGVRALVAPFHFQFRSLGERISWCCGRPGNLERAAVLARLTAEPGRHVVFVRYSPRHRFLEEWVYNEADIDHAKIVWALDTGPERDRELIQYFHGRKLWTVDADAVPARLVPVL